MHAASRMNWNAKCAAGPAPPRAMRHNRCPRYARWACCRKRPSSAGSPDGPRPPRRQSKKGRSPWTHRSPVSANNRIFGPTAIGRASTRTLTNAGTLMNVWVGASSVQESSADHKRICKGDCVRQRSHTGRIQRSQRPLLSNKPTSTVGHFLPQKGYCGDSSEKFFAIQSMTLERP